MSTHRSNRVAEEIKKEVAVMIRDEIKDPRIGFITITAVDVTNDLRHSKIFISILGSAEEKEASIKALNKANGFIRSKLGRRIRLCYTPEITFIFDDSIEHGAKIMTLLNKVKADKGEEKGE